MFLKSKERYVLGEIHKYSVLSLMSLSFLLYLMFLEQADVEDYMQRNGIFDLLSVPHLSTSSADSSSGNTSSSLSDSSVCDTSTVSNGSDFSSR